MWVVVQLSQVWDVEVWVAVQLSQVWDVEVVVTLLEAETGYAADGRVALLHEGVQVDEERLLVLAHPHLVNTETIPQWRGSRTSLQVKK